MRNGTPVYIRHFRNHALWLVIIVKRGNVWGESVIADLGCCWNRSFAARMIPQRVGIMFVGVVVWGEACVSVIPGSLSIIDSQ